MLRKPHITRAARPARRSLMRSSGLHGPRMFAVLPTLLTLGNAVCGFGAITFAAKVGPEVTEGTNAVFIAALLIYAAMIFDALDGSAARWARQASNFGAQLDSLCDAISFGVAPAFVMLKFSPYYHPRLLWVIGVLYMLCAVLRLARFNVETDEDDSHSYFSGLPSPAAAGTVASFPIAVHGLARWPVNETLIAAAHWMLPIVTLAVAILMVSRIRYPHLFNQWFRGRKDSRHLLQLIFAIVVVFAVRELAIPLIFCAFALYSPLRALWAKALNRGSAEAPREAAAQGETAAGPDAPAADDLSHTDDLLAEEETASRSRDENRPATGD